MHDLLPPDPPLADEAVELRPWERSDAEDVFLAFQDRELHRWLLEVPDPYTRQAADGFLVERTVGWLSGTQAAFAIVDRSTARLAGGVSVYLDGPEGTLAYWLEPGSRHRGLASRAVRLVVGWAFDGLKLDRLSLWTLEGNVASERLAERSGFRREGLRTAIAPGASGPIDAILYRMDRLDHLARVPAPSEAPARSRPARRDTRGMPEPISPPDPPLAAGPVRLRPFEPRDVPAVTASCQDPEIHRWIPVIPYPYLEVDARDFVAAAVEGWRSGSGCAFAMEDAETGSLVGSVTLHLTAVPHRASIGYWVACEARGRGIATAAVRLVSRWAFERFPLARLELWTAPGNRASQAVAERTGFRYEGVLRDWERDPEGPADVVMFALTREDLEDGAGDEGPAEAGEPAGPRVAATPPELRAPGTRAAPYIDLLAVADVTEGSMLRVTRADLDLLVAHTPNGLVVTDDRCPHMAAPLSIGALEGCVVGCPLHEGRFDLCSGETVQMPTTGGLDAEGVYHAAWSPRGTPPKPEPASKKLEARRLTRVNRLRYYRARIRNGRLEAQLPIVPE